MRQILGSRMQEKEAKIMALTSSPELKAWWFSLSSDQRKTLNLRSCTIAWNASKAKSDLMIQELQKEVRSLEAERETEDI